MLSVVDLTAGPQFSVSTVDCQDDHRGWSAEEPRTDVRLVLVRHGGFRRRVNGEATDLDRTVGYLGLPDEEEHFAHPAGGDTCTSISLTPSLWRSLAGDNPRLHSSSLYINGKLDLAHRRLLAATNAENLLSLAAEAVRQIVTTTIPDTRPSAADRTLVARAREAINAGTPAAAGLLPLATLLDISPYRLSRAFTRELGVSLTRYRNRVRVSNALDRLEAGEPSLATLAADLGFADQAHLCRTVQDHLGHTPTTLRKLLKAEQAPSQ